MACQFTNATATDIGGAFAYSTSFENADLSYAIISAAGFNGFHGVQFKGTNLAHSTLSGIFMVCDFGPGSNGNTSMASADLTAARLLMANQSPQTQLQNVDFSNALVSAATFYVEINFDAVNPMFRGAKFTNIQPNNIFAGDYLKGFDLAGVDFEGVDLSGSDLSGAFNLGQADFSKAILSNGTSGANLAGINLEKYTGFAGDPNVPGSGKNLNGVDFTGANLYQANLAQVQMRNATLHGANLNYTNLYGADLSGIQMGASPAEAPRLPGSLTGAYMPLANLSNADLRYVNLSSAHVYGAGASFKQAHLESADFSSASLQEADFTEAIATATIFDDASLVNTSFSGANLESARFVSARLQGTDFSAASIVTGMQLDNSAVSTASGAWTFTENNSNPVSYGYKATLLGVLAGNTAVAGATCPSSQSAPCNTAASLIANRNGPYPSAIPGCNPVYKDPNFPSCHYFNCLAPTPP